MRLALSEHLQGVLTVLSVQKRAPVDYSKCDQTVTVYHWDGKETYTRTVLRRAFLDFRKTLNTDKTGSREANSFLLVIPCEEQGVFVGDKVLLGEGPEVSTREAWAALVPSKVPGLVVVKYVDPKYWGGKLVHVEAGG